ncbi:MAG: hypothetical protein ICV65_05780 [Flavisolibacter sp.]|nr:hypothetical protein [Flavisolibacter sp.]
MAKLYKPFAAFSRTKQPSYTAIGGVLPTAYRCPPAFAWASVVLRIFTAYNYWKGVGLFSSRASLMIVPAHLQPISTNQQTTPLRICCKAVLFTR